MRGSLRYDVWWLYIQEHIRFSSLAAALLSVTNQVFIEAYPEPTRQLNYKKLNLKKFDPGAVVRYDGGFHLVSDPIRKPG